MGVWLAKAASLKEMLPDFMVYTEQQIRNLSFICKIIKLSLINVLYSYFIAVRDMMSHNVDIIMKWRSLMPLYPALFPPSK